MNRQMNREVSLEPLSLAEAIEAEPTRIADGWGWDWHYVAVGLYARQLRRYFDLFPRERILVLLYDDLVRDPSAPSRGLPAHRRGRGVRARHARPRHGWRARAE